jgi:nicotinate-nucleotide pyrophosphorylase (carboxylating)
MGKTKLPTLRQRLLMALEEDQAFDDVTTEGTIDKIVKAEARLVAKEPGILAGIEVFKAVFRLVDKSIEVLAEAENGTRLRRGQVAARLQGPLAAILRGERLALNLVAHLSGVATETAKCVAATAGTKTAILDTRKTTPLWRDLEREAVRAGGGQSHRRHLAHMILVKDNHVDANGSVSATLERLWRRGKPRHRVIVETRTLREVREALAFPVDVILLDNMNRRQIAKAVGLIGGRAQVEVSGGLGPRDIRPLARLGVDRISIGSITHSNPSLDFSLRIEPPRKAA